MKSGQMVKLRAYGGKELVRRIIRFDEEIVVVCLPDEYEKACLENREPVGVGFHLKDVVDETVGEIDKDRGGDGYESLS